MLPNSFATGRDKDRQPRHSMVTLIVTVFVAGFLVTAGAIMLKDRRSTQLSLGDGQYLRAGRVIADILEWTPLGHKYEVVVATTLAAIGLASASCSVQSLHG